MTFYSKTINEIMANLSEQEIEYLARIKILEFLRENYTGNEIKEEVQDLMRIEQLNQSNQREHPLLIGKEKKFL